MSKILPVELQLRNGAKLEESGDLERALSFYRELEKKYADDVRIVGSIGRVLLRMGRLDEAEDLYLRERAVRADTLIFGRELEAVHRAQRRFGVAALDCINVLRNDPLSYDWARSELIGISKERETLDVVTWTLRQYREDEKSGGLMSSLLAEMYLRASQDSIAFAEILYADEKSGNNGEKIFQFASLARALGRSQTALLALGEVEKKFGDAPISRQSSVFALEISLNLEDREAAIKRLQLLSLNDAVPYLSRAAKKRLAVLFLDGLSDYAHSSYLISCLLSESDFEKPELLILLSRCYLGMEEFDRADSSLSEVLNSEGSSHKDEALFRRANISFYKGALDDAVTKYFELAEKLPGTDYSNDGLEMAMLIDENRKDSNRLSMFSKALLLSEIGKKDSSIVLLENMTGDSVRTSLEAHALFELGCLLEEKGRDSLAYEAFLKLGEREPGDRLSPFALERAGEIKEKLLDFSTASSLYEKAILKYPGSVVVPEIREKLNELRRKVRS
ncbi:MAG: tetratricopeptide repeat protein [Candidatus Eisenbacteria bacterium]|nr:tetratricopeptide repeat protein [Candidatus Eisenbacteria bacterium]